MISNILIALVSWVIGYALGGPVVSVILPVVLVGGITLPQRAVSRGHALRLSANGVEFLRRDGRIVRIRWADIEQVTVMAQKKSGVIAPSGPHRRGQRRGGVRGRQHRRGTRRQGRRAHA